jgi:hypothetical protein
MESVCPLQQKAVKVKKAPEIKKPERKARSGGKLD